MNSEDDVLSKVKQFGMTNQLIEVNLDKIEKDYHVDLGRPKKSEEWENSYYPQFDEEIRAEAAAMSHYYEVFYCLEKTIRSLISDSLEDAEKGDWWNSGRIPNKVHDEVAGRIKKEVDSGITIRSSNNIDYTTFGELSEIIKSNWDIFGGMFTSSRAVERVIANLNLLRGPIAHCSLLAEDEILRLELSLRDWFRLME